MAQNQSEPPITPSDQEADVVFRVQMQVANLLLGYWKQGLGVIGAVLLITLVVGQGSTCIRDSQRGYSAAIAKVARDVPQPSQLSFYGLGPADDLSDSAHVEALRKGAEGYEAVGEDAWGLSAGEAWIRAGDTWMRLQEKEKAMHAFEQAYEADRGGIYTFAAGNRLAVLYIEADRVGEARAIYRDLATSLKGYLAEQALIEVMELDLEAGDAAALKKSAAEFRARFPESPRLEQATLLEARGQEMGT